MAITKKTEPSGVGVTGHAAPSDLAKLWDVAIEAYNRNISHKARRGKDVTFQSLPRVHSLQDVVRQVDTASESLQERLHDGGRVDRLRGAVFKYLGLAQSVGDLVVQSAVATFPPASAIWTVATYAIKTTQAQNADYDKLIGLIAETGGFLQVLAIIETKVPDSQQYAKCVVEVYTSLLVIFAVQTRYMNENGFITFFKEAVRGNDPELANAYDSIRNAIDRLSQANGFRAVANTGDILKLMADLGFKLDMQHEELRQIFAVQREDLKTLLLSSQKQEDLLQGVGQMLREMKRNVDLKDQERDPSNPTANRLPARNISLNIVEQFFDNPTDSTIQFREIEHRLAQGTCEWVFQHDSFIDWKAQMFHILWISGDAGMGKSCIAASVIQQLQVNATREEATSLAYYFFNDEHEELQSLRNALSCVVMQIAASMKTYCDQVATELGDLKEPLDQPASIWNTLIASKFGADGAGKLWLVLDGIDELKMESRAILLGLLEEVRQSELQVYVLITGQVQTETMTKLEPRIIDITREDIASDIGWLVQRRCKDLKVSHRIKSRIKKRLEEKADGFRYVEYVLHDLKAATSARSIIQTLGDLPENLNLLFTYFLVKSSIGKSQDRLEAARLLYAFVAFAKRPLTLAEARYLVAMKAGVIEALQIEEEIRKDSAIFLDLSRSLKSDDPDEGPEEGPRMGWITDIVSDDFDDDRDDRDDDLRLKFRDKSLRRYFTEKPPGSSIALRTPASQAHLELFEVAVENLCSSSDKSTYDMLEYSVSFWHHHLASICVESVSDIEAVRVVTSLGKLLQFANNASRAMALGFDSKPLTLGRAYFDDSSYDFYQNFATFEPVFSAWNQRVANLDEAESSTTASQWLEETHAKGCSSVLRRLARGHIEKWFLSLSATECAFSCALAMEALASAGASERGITGYCHDYEPKSTAEKIEDAAHFLGLLDALAPASYRGVGHALWVVEEYDKAVEYFQIGLAKCITEEDRFLTLGALATVYEDLARISNEKEQQHQEYLLDAYRNATGALEIRFDPKLVRDFKRLQRRRQFYLSVRAYCEEEFGNHKDAVKTLQEVSNLKREVFKYSYNDDVLDSVVKLLAQTDQYSELLRAVKDAELQDRLYWLCAVSELDFIFLNSGPHGIFQKAAKLSSQQRVTAINHEQTTSLTENPVENSITDRSGLDLMVAVYEELIEYLGRFKRSACLRYKLALAYWRVIGDRVAARSLMDTILNGDSCAHPMTGEESQGVLVAIRSDFMDLIFEDFRSASDAKTKARLLDEFEGIAFRALGQSHGFFHLYDLLCASTQAKMIKRVRSGAEFQEFMQKSFRACVDILNDKVSWNDAYGLAALGRILLCIDGLEEDAQIALSMQMSQIDKSLDLEEDSEVQDDAHVVGTTDVQTPPAEASSAGMVLADNDSVEEDVLRGIPLYCNGICERRFSSWKEVGRLYACRTCVACDLCPDCYDKRRALNLVENPEGVWRTFCGTEHEYLETPIEGWRGVKDGWIRFGDKVIEFKTWLRELEEVRWRQAWENFWRGA